MLVSALNDSDGAAVDWWFIYKLPDKVVGTAGSGDGLDYLYYDALGGAPLKLSPNRLGASGDALSRTLAQLFPSGDGAGAPDMIWYLYNDEIPDTTRNDDDKGHTKGVVCFDPESKSGFWLLHSTPRYPVPGSAAFPSDEIIYGQTFLCITLGDMATVNAIAGLMQANQTPQIYKFNLPAGVAETDAVYQLCHGVAPTNPPGSARLDITSKGGNAFICFAKDRGWGKDFWTDQVGPGLGVDLGIESWRRGAIPADTDSTAGLDVTDIKGVNLAPLGVDASWSYTRDHAKWAVSTTPSWVCVADINRQVSQEKRGGGAICFKDHTLWQGLSAIDELKSAN